MFCAAISFQFLSCQREKIEKVERFLHKPNMPKMAKLTHNRQAKKGRKEVKFCKSNDTLREKTIGTDLISSLSHAAFERFTQSTVKCTIPV